MSEEFENLLHAIAFTARAHRHQLRKDRDTPYVSHAYRVCMIVRHLFGINDPNVLVAAVLHDVIEDTQTDCDDIVEQFGAEIAGWVAMLSKDKRMPDQERERSYEEVLRRAPWQVKLCKLADIYDNLLDASRLPREQQERTRSRSQRYLAAVATDSPEYLGPAIAKVKELIERQ